MGWVFFKRRELGILQALGVDSSGDADAGAGSVLRPPGDREGRSDWTHLPVAHRRDPGAPAQEDLPPARPTWLGGVPLSDFLAFVVQVLPAALPGA